MKKSIVFELKPDEDKLFNVKMFHDENIVKEAKVNSDEMKDYMMSKFNEKDLSMARKAIGLFKPKEIKIHLKEG